MQAIAARLIGEESLRPMEMVIASSLVDADGGQPHDGGATQARTSVAVASEMIP